MPEEYGWLAEHLHAMTAELGVEDRIIYQRPFGSFVSTNYPMLANTLASTRMSGHIDAQTAELADQALIAHYGALRLRFETVQAELKNPIALVGRGLRFVLSVPLLLLGWLGLLRPASVLKARQSWVFRLAQFVATLAVAGAGVVTVVNGWGAFLAQLHAWFSWMP